MKFYNFLVIFVTSLFWVNCGIVSAIFAQGLEFKENPLNEKTDSELVPTIERDLTNFEKKRVLAKIAELDQQAESELKAGNQDQAFLIWYETIKLSRFIDKETEIKTITRVGAVAWEKSRNQELNFLMERLLVLESESTKNEQIEPEFLSLFAEAYETLHNLDKSIAVNQQILAIARQKEDTLKIIETLDKLGKFYLGKFDYYQALPIYEELLSLAQQNENYLQEGIYLRKLAEINGAILKPENAINYKQKLAENYLANQQLQQIPFLKIAIGDDYKMLDKPEEASQYYQEAFALAWSLEQYAIAGDALKKLGKLYQNYEQLDYALQIYQELIKIEQQSYNLYGLMNTYEQIGNIYQKKQDYPQARQALEKALEIARHIKHKEDYFLGKISELDNNIIPSES